ncbi:MAG: hypothetical protein ACREMW_09625 [Gemmatimonadales bacterium]
MLLRTALRRLIGIALFILTPASTLEAVVGVVRDGSVHHEGTAVAAEHQVMGTNGDHGHEDGLPPWQHRHTPQHQHGTAADHCTHVHGVALTASYDLTLGTPVLDQPQTEPPIHTDWSSRGEFHPPRA